MGVVKPLLQLVVIGGWTAYSLGVVLRRGGTELLVRPPIEALLFPTVGMIAAVLGLEFAFAVFARLRGGE